MTAAEMVAPTLRAPAMGRRAFASISGWSKTCGCGRVHDYTAWSSLPLVGEMPDGDGRRLQLRNCACGSSIAIELCAVDGCEAHPTWTADDETLAHYCEEHCLEWLRSEESKR